ncbi:hypothetical protein [Streptomyces sp. 061-3]|uniref:hypothetical protein n=1 Tax=Streptomyces sp. 061-3 TaxID=2789268 RepID=UPI00398019CD
MLTALGLAEEEDAVYRAVVVHPDAPAVELTRVLTAPGMVMSASAGSLPDVRPGADAAVSFVPTAGWSETGVTAVLRRLVTAGLAVTEAGPDGEPRYRATPPALALEPLLTARRDDLRQAETVIARLAEQYRASQLDRPGAPVEVVMGREAVRHRFLQVQLTAQREILGFQPLLGPSSVVPVEENAAEAEAMRRGVHYRVVLERAWLDQPRTAHLVNTATGAGQELTVVDSLPMSMVIADSRIAMVPLGPPDRNSEPGAIIIHESGLLKALLALFHSYRERGWRLTGAKRDPAAAPPASDHPTEDPGEESCEMDRAILALLHVGLTDASIAKQLGVGHRTVQRRLRKLMDLAGARTRFQLGCYAVLTGRVPDAGISSAAPPHAPGSSPVGATSEPGGQEE